MALAAYGQFHPFMFHADQTRIRESVVYKVNSLDFIIQQNSADFPTSIQLINVDTGAITAPTITQYNYLINDVTVQTARIKANLMPNQRYYLKLVAPVIGQTYYTDLIERCDSIGIRTRNNCSNQHHDWDNDPTPLIIPLPNYQQLQPEVVNEFETIVTEKGTVNRPLRSIARQGLQIVAPSNYATILSAAAAQSENILFGKPIKNLEVTSSDIGIGYSQITLRYEFIELIEGSKCCDDLNLDDIEIGEPNTGSEECAAFSVAVNESGGTLSVTLNDAPIGTPIYRWFRNGVFISSASSISVISAGEYRVDVNVAGCIKTDSFFIENPCNVLSVRVYATGNVLNADINGEPEGVTSTIEIIYNGEIVGSSLPFSGAEESGIYFVRVTNGDCVRSGGAFVNVNETTCDFEASIQVDGNLLTAVTDADTPTYLWEYEDQTGRTTIGTGTTATTDKTGIYWLTVSQGECEVERYIYHVSANDCQKISICNWNEMPAWNRVFDQFLLATGPSVDLINIDLSIVTNPNIQLSVFRNGVKLIYNVAGPTDIDEYGISGNSITFAPDFPLEGEDVSVFFM